jgi:D-alanyl-D-alanine carboxypeptidase
MQPRSFQRLSLFAALAGLCLTQTVQAGPYLLVEVDSGRVLTQSDAGRPWYPASVTKLMTTYLAFQAMHERRLEPLSLLKVSETAHVQPPSKMGFPVGTEITLDNAIKMLMVRSANDIAVVIAEGVGGTLENFIQQMNLTAGKLGMSGTRFVNPHGLPDENQVTTARDMAILSRALLREFPEYELYFRIPAIQLGKRIMRNHNRLIDRYPGADGMKTGFICSSGFNMVAGAQRDGKRLLAVVFGAYSATQRAEDAATLLERGFARPPILAAMPSIDAISLDAITNVTGQPYDMRDEMCNPKRKRPTAHSSFDENDDEEEGERGSDAKGKSAKPERASLLGPLTSSMPPVRVYVGLPKMTPENETVKSVAEPRPAKKMPAKKPEQSAAKKTEQASPVAPKPAAARVK